MAWPLTKKPVMPQTGTAADVVASAAVDEVVRSFVAVEAVMIVVSSTVVVAASGGEVVVESSTYVLVDSAAEVAVVSTTDVSTAEVSVTELLVAPSETTAVLRAELAIALQGLAATVEAAARATKSDLY